MLYTNEISLMLSLYCKNMFLKIFFLGTKTIEGELISQGIRVQRHRLRDSIKRVDPVGRRLRSLNSIHRRVYNVRSPLALWHMDGNHKLIRFVHIE